MSLRSSENVYMGYQTDSLKKNNNQMESILACLSEVYSQSENKTAYDTRYQLLIHTILLTQSTDEVVNRIARNLFIHCPTPEDMVAIGRRELELLIQDSGFSRQKAKYLQETSRILLEKHNGEPPKTLIELTQLPGVARKTANMFLAEAFETAEGVIVDTHVHRVSNRLGVSQGKSASKVEHDLVKITDASDRIRLAQLFMAHGQKVCYIHEPACGDCILKALCAYAATAER